MSQDTRQNPFAQTSYGAGEPAADLLTGIIPPRIAALDRAGRSGVRRTAIHPSEKDRRSRRINITFSDSFIADRLRALAEKWELVAPDGHSPNVSLLVEHLLLPQLEAAERGEIEPPVTERKWVG